MQQEKKMSTSTKLALVVLTFAGVAGSTAYAAENKNEDAGRRAVMRFERLDKDQSGDLSFDEFFAAMRTRMGDADTNHDGKVTSDEIVAAYEKMRAQRMADRLMRRFDSNNDGALTADEIEARQKRVFARLDKNSDGKIELSEMPKRRQMRQDMGEQGGPRMDEGMPAPEQNGTQQ
jgi:Ca2+-binding EF-hand superfamily protein